MEWISIKEKYPNKDDFEVLVKVDEPFFGSTEPKLIVAYWASDLNKWMCDLTSREIHHVTHWQYLPELPKI